MCGKVRGQQTLLLVGSVEDRIPSKHPLQKIKELTDAVLARMSRIFEAIYSEVGCSSVVCRRAIEKIFGWLKTIGDWERTRFRGLERVALGACLAAAAFNLM